MLQAKYMHPVDIVNLSRAPYEIKKHRLSVADL